MKPRPFQNHLPTVSTPKDNSLLAATGVSEQTIAKGTLGVHQDTVLAVERLQEKQRGFIRSFFTEKGLTKVLEDQQVKMVEDFGAYQRAAFRLASDTKLDMAHTMCLAISRELKVDYQARFTALVLEKHEVLRRAVQDKREGFLADVDAAFTNAEKYAHREWLAERAIQSIQAEVEQYFTWMDQLLDDFISISAQRLDEYRKAEESEAPSSNPRPTLG